MRRGASRGPGLRTRRCSPSQPGSSSLWTTSNGTWQASGWCCSHPNVHRFSEDQQREVTEWIYEHLWSRGLPLVQIQDHLVIYRGREAPGLI